MQIILVDGLKAGADGAENMDCLLKICEKCSETSHIRLVFPKGIYEIGDAKSKGDLDDLLSGRFSPNTRWNDTGSHLYVEVRDGPCGPPLPRHIGCTKFLQILHISIIMV